MNEQIRLKFGTPELLEDLRNICQRVEALPPSDHASNLSALLGDAAFGLQRLQATGDHFWPFLARSARESVANVEQAMQVVTQAIHSDPDYAWSWHCNLAVSATDEGLGRKESQQAAARFLQLAFKYDITETKHYRDWMRLWEAAQADSGEVIKEAIDARTGNWSVRLNKTRTSKPNDCVVMRIEVNGGDISVGETEALISEINNAGLVVSPSVESSVEPPVGDSPEQQEEQACEDDTDEDEEDYENSYTIRHAKAEFKIAGYTPVDEPQENGPNKWIQENVLELLRVFVSQGHSGFSAPWVINMFRLLAEQKPLTPLTGADEEWGQPSIHNGVATYQNRRMSSVFKDVDAAGNVLSVRDVGGRVFREPDGGCYTSRGSSVDVTFPYTAPEKPEFINVDAEGNPAAVLDWNMTKYQTAVGEWLTSTFGPTLSQDKEERVFRFLEEALELAQAAGVTFEDVHKLCYYTFGRPAGEVSQEVGGVMVTVNALCNAYGIDIGEAAGRELHRIQDPIMVGIIRSKAEQKPRNSPLPGEYLIILDSLTGFKPTEE